MEGKNVIMTTLLLSLVLAQIQVEAENCPTTFARYCFNICRDAGNPQGICARVCGCTITSGNEYHGILENTGDNAFNEYCKLGCASSVCGAMTTLQNSDASEVVNGAVEKCIKACSAFCTKGSITAVEVETA